MSLKYARRGSHLPKSVRKAYLCRDFEMRECSFSNKSDAQRFYNELGKRLAMFHLQLSF